MLGNTGADSWSAVSRAGGTPGWLLNLGTGTWSFSRSSPGRFSLLYQNNFASSLYDLGHGPAWDDGHAARSIA